MRVRMRALPGSRFFYSWIPMPVPVSVPIITSVTVIIPLVTLRFFIFSLWMASRSGVLCRTLMWIPVSKFVPTFFWLGGSSLFTFFRLSHPGYFKVLFLEFVAEILVSWKGPSTPVHSLHPAHPPVSTHIFGYHLLLPLFTIHMRDFHPRPLIESLCI